MVYFIKISEDTLHLAAHDPVFVPRLIIGARVKAAAQKTHHLILVQIHEGGAHMTAGKTAELQHGLENSHIGAAFHDFTDFIGNFLLL